MPQKQFVDITRAPEKELIVAQTLKIMEAADVWDVVVIGAGIEGSATAYQLAKNNQKTLLIEQFPLPHSRGSSHGQSRITRMAYGDQEFYTHMMLESFKLWETLEKESGTSLYTQTGLLQVASDTHYGPVRGTVTALSKFNIPHLKLNCKEMKEKYPMLWMPDSAEGVVDYSGGILRADKALTAFQSQFVKQGGTLHDGEKVLSIYPGDIITIRTNKNSYRSRNIILTVGPWAAQMLPSLGLNLPLKPVRISVCYWKEKRPGQYGPDGFPTFLHDYGSGDFDVYGLPSEEYPGLFKLCLHQGPDIDPDARDKADDGWVLERMKEYTAKYFPGLEPTPSIVETCIYTNTPDHDFILDRHPSWRNIIVGAGFSGHGFKLSPVVGKVLAELAMKKEPSYDLSHFKIDRFFQKSKL